MATRILVTPFGSPSRTVRSASRSALVWARSACSTTSPAVGGDAVAVWFFDDLVRRVDGSRVFVAVVVIGGLRGW